MGIYQNHLLIMESNKLRLDISRAAYVELNASWKYKKNASAYFTRVYFVTEGEADVLCDNRPYKLQAGNIYIIPAGTPFCYDCKQRLCKLYFQVNLYSSMGEDLPIAPKGCIVLEHRTEEIRQTVELFYKKDFQSALAVRQRVEQILLEAMQADTLPIPHYSAPIRKTLRRMGETPSMAMTVEVLADGVHLSPAAFQKRFKDEVGISPIRYLRRRVVAAVEKELKTTELSLREIAEKYGFCDQFHLSRVFTAYTGTSPSKYRKSGMF